MINRLAIHHTNRLGLVVALAVSGIINVALVPASRAQTATATATNAAVADAPHTNTAIVPRLNQGFMGRHNSFVEVAGRGDIDVLFMGDSITDWWRNAPNDGGSDAFSHYFGQWKVANFGIAGDTTQGVLWRLQNGEGKGYKPKAIMMMIGTNNTGRNTADEIAEGVEADVAELRKDFPDAKILLLAIFPRGLPTDPVRGKISDINKQFAKLDGKDNVTYMDIGGKFLAEDGTFLPSVFRNDRLHPAIKGYEIWGEAVKPTLEKMLKGN